MPPKLPRNSSRSSSTMPNMLDPRKAMGAIADSAVGQGQKTGTGDSTLNAMQRLGTSRLDSRLGMMRGGMLFRLYRYIPYPILMLLPFIREDGKQLIRNLQQRRSGQAATAEAEAPPAEIKSALRPYASSRGARSPYLRYRCPEHPLSCSQLQQTLAVEEAPSHCLQCGFPGLLQENANIQGRRGRYRVGRFLGMRGLGRLYVGQDVNRRQAVVIREYVLPQRHFNASEQYVIRDAFETIAGLKLADGREQDFRIMEPWDAMGDSPSEARRDLQLPERCYLITPGPVDTYPTLRSELIEHGAFTPSQVRQVLNQVLQTLESLHGQKYILPAGQIQNGLIHGNLNLDSLVMLPEAESYYERPQLLVFLRDLALWEFLFIPPPAPAHLPQVEDDLHALGQIGFYLLTGRWLDAYGRRLKPQNPTVWPGRDLPLEQYLRQLQGLETPSFKSAFAARQALLRLPSPPDVSPTPLTAAVAPTELTRTRRSPLWLWLLLLGGLGLLIAFVVGWWWSRRQAVASQPPMGCCVVDVPVPPGQFNYAAERQGTWYPLWHSKNLVAQGKSLEQVLESQQPDLDLQLTPVPDRQAAIDQVLGDAADFAIAPLPDNGFADLTVEPIAYDGLAIVVAFSYVERDRGLPHHLEGQMSLAQLRQLYTGEIRNWQELGGPDLPVKLYLPAQPELIQVFEQRVLQTAAAIQTFRRQWGLEALQEPTQAADFIATPELNAIQGQVLPTQVMLRTVLKDFEADTQTGGIGFTSISQIYGQCSVYPLAIAPDADAAIQPLYQLNGAPISPAVDLCGDKGDYAPKPSLFADQTYPLAYPLGVIYRPDNSRVPIGPAFAQLFTTDEGQQLLQKTGLVPLRVVTPRDHEAP